MTYREFTDLKGLTFTSVTRGDDTIDFVCEDGRRFQQRHDQNCCENVYIADLIGDLNDLVGSPILVAEERQSDDPPPDDGYFPDSYTWTFYTLRTLKGSVDIRWYGESNGYYSETADLVEING